MSLVNGMKKLPCWTHEGMELFHDLPFCCKDKVNFVEELQYLNSFLVCHHLLDYNEFSGCVDNFALPEKPLVFLSRKKNK